MKLVKVISPTGLETLGFDEEDFIVVAGVKLDKKKFLRAGAG